MLCSAFSIEHILIDLVILAAVVAFVRLLLPLILGALGVAGSVVERAIQILIWVVVVVTLIILFFDILGCAGGGHW